MKGLVSIIMPVYNAKKYLGAALDSVFSQTWQDFEIIIVDDGSTDNSISIIEDYREKYPNRIKYFSQKNDGAARARNAGLAHARGEYVAFLDADDVWAANKLKRQMESFEQHPECALVYSNAHFIGTDGNNLNRLYAKADEFDIPTEEMFPRLLLRNFIPFSSVIVKKAVIDKVGPFDASYKNTEDTDLLLRIAHDYKTLGVNENLIQYRIHGGNVSRDLAARHWDSIRMLKKNITLYPEIAGKLGGKLNKRFSSKYFDYGYTFFEKNDFTRARRQFVQSIKYSFFHNCRKYMYLFFCLMPPSWIKFSRGIKRRI